jgi:outer membrane receptor protein involved in Fe transport
LRRSRPEESLGTVSSFASIADFVDDNPYQMTRTVNPQTGLPDTTRCDEQIYEGDAFLQDDWKARPNLTLNLGLRYDYFGPYTDTHNRFRDFVPGTGSYVDQIANGVVNVTPRGWNPEKLDFAPRFGFAWDLGGKAKNVIRGGYGLWYDRMATVQTATYRTNPPLSAQAN